ncbi:MAG: iron-containing alcohol dehydrogenase [Proteobacteria bacterium]|nr:iron-containing alcohol dehydrogenase [Pseudomonadota bacterium]
MHLARQLQNSKIICPGPFRWRRYRSPWADAAGCSNGGNGFQKGLGAVHSVSHPIGAIYGVHNGLTNGVVMPYVLAFNAPNIGDKMQRLAAYIGWIDGKSSGASAVRAINDWILQLRSEIGISATIADIGVEKEKFADIARFAVVDPAAGTNPVPLTEENV